MNLTRVKSTRASYEQNGKVKNTEILGQGSGNYQIKRKQNNFTKSKKLNTFTTRQLSKCKFSRCLIWCDRCNPSVASLKKIFKIKSDEFHAHSSSFIHKKCKNSVGSINNLHLIPHFDKYTRYIILIRCRKANKNKREK